MDAREGMATLPANCNAYDCRFRRVLLLDAASKGIDEHTTVKWMNIILTAVFVFGFAVKNFWRFRKRRAFWVELGALLVVHFVILQRLQWQKANYFWLMIVFGIPEMFVVFFLISLMFNPKVGPPSADFPKQVRPPDQESGSSLD